MTIITGAALQVEHVSKSFTDRSGSVHALSDVSFSVSGGEFYSIVGPSGCGKSTLLNVIAGLEPEDAGSITVGADASVGPYPAKEPRGATEGHAHEIPRQARDDGESKAERRLGTVAYMPQKDLLLPWRTVLENAALGLELTGVPRKVAQQRAADLMARFGLNGFADNYPATLSGGMRQRAAFLRTILTDRPLILLDEPFGALDALTRRSMQEWLLDVWSEVQHTVVLITHDVDEAIFLSDRVAVMSPRPGRIIAEHMVAIPRPRHSAAVTDPAFVEIKRAVLTDLHAGLEGGAGHASE